MSSVGAGYDLSSTTFSPDGRVFQVEYAQKAVDNSGTVLGLRVRDGVVLAIEKPVISKLAVPGANRRILSADRSVGMAGAGLAADCRMVVNRARGECQNYKHFYGSAMPTEVLAERIASYVHLFTLYWSVRPCGASTLVAGCDQSGGERTPQLYLVEPNGVVQRFYGTALGKARQSAKSEIEKLDLSSMSAKEAVKAAAKIIYQVHDESKDKKFELEMTWIAPETDYEHRRVPADMLAEAEAEAKAAIEAMDE
ncbi:proteasome subunit alpha 7 [Pycnococcus provasolii]